MATNDLKYDPPDLPPLREIVPVFRDELEQTKASLEEHRASVDERFDEVDDRLDKVDAHLVQTNERLGRLEHKLDDDWQERFDVLLAAVLKQNENHVQQKPIASSPVVQAGVVIALLIVLTAAVGTPLTKVVTPMVELFTEGGP